MKAIGGFGIEGLAAFVVPFCVTNGGLVPGNGLLLIAGGCLGNVLTSDCLEEGRAKSH